MISQNAAHSQSSMRPGEVIAIEPRRLSATGAELETTGMRRV